MRHILYSTCLLIFMLAAAYAQQRAPKLTLKGHSDDVKTIAFSADGKTIVSGSIDKTVILWDVQTGQVKQRFTKHQGWVWTLAFSSDEETVVSACFDTSDVWVWDAHTGEPRRRLTPQLSAMAFSRTGEVFIGARGESLYTWDTQTWKRNRTGTPHTDAIYIISLSSDGKTLASGDRDGTIILWDTESWRPIQKIKLQNWIKSLAFSPDGKKLVVGSAVMNASGNQIAGEINVWDLAAKKSITLMKSPEIVWSVSVSPNGKLIVGASRGGKIRIWDAQTEKLKDTFDGHDKIVFEAIFSPDGALLASCGGDGTIKLWDISNIY
jgi:tricorn protease-like protein